MTDNVPRLDLLRSFMTKRLIRAYGPVLLIALAFLLLALLIPTVERTISP